jgi:Flp pilus assembly protein TadD
MFYVQLKEFNNAILTINQLIRLRPSAHDLYLTGGVLYEQSGDSISARRFYEKSLAICTITLDSMNKKNTAYEMLLGNKAINYIMLGDTTKANEILGTLLANQTDGEMKRITLSMMNKNRDELLRQFSLPNPTSN